MAARLHTREDSGLVLDREGRWLHDGEPIRHPRIIDAFNRGLERSPDGRYRLRFGNDWCFVEVADAPLQVLAVLDGSGEPESELRVILNNGSREVLDPRSLSLEGGILYCLSRANLKARFSRSAHFALGRRLERGRNGRLYLELGGIRHEIREDPPESPVAPQPNGE